LLNLIKKYDFLKLRRKFERFFEEYSKNISPKAFTKVITKASMCGYVVPFALGY